VQKRKHPNNQIQWKVGIEFMIGSKSALFSNFPV